MHQSITDTGLVQMDFGQNRPRSSGPNRSPIAPKLLEIARNERFSCTLPGYPGIYLGPRGCRERVDSRSWIFDPIQIKIEYFLKICVHGTLHFDQIWVRVQHFRKI